MPFSQGSRSGLSYVVESVYGTNPGGTFNALGFNTHSLNLSKDRVQGNEIRPDRIPRVDRHGNRQIGGDIEIDLRKGDYDDLLESALFSTFDTNNELKVGTTLKSFSIEDAAEDISQYRLFTGVAVSTLSISIAPNQMVTATFGMVGKDMSISSSGVTTSAASTNQPFDAYSGDIFIQDQGGTDTAIASITSVEINIDNGLNPTFVVGDDATPQLEYGRAEVTGTITAYFEDDALINRFINETETEVKVSVDDPTGTNPYTFFFPRAKINGADIPVENPQSRIITMPFVAIYDSTEESNIVITRTA